MNASFECNWIDQTKNFKQMLIITRNACQKELKFNAALFDFSLECLYQTVYNAYGYCNNMNSVIKK